MSWNKLLEAASESLNDHVRLRNDYLMAENHILRHQIEGRVQLTDSERKELADARPMRTQSMAQVVDLSLARCRQIRGGLRWYS